MTRRPLTLVWNRRARQDLALAAAWNQHGAREVAEAMERMAAVGWSLGRPACGGTLRYFPVPPFGVLYRVRGRELRIVRLVNVRRLRGELP
jgi:hypothetical protein